MQLKIRHLLLLLFFLILSDTCAFAAKRESGFSVPRFLSIRTDKVNARYGPGQKYPVMYELKSRNAPVKVTKEYYGWYYLTDIEKRQYWIHKSQLSGQRWALVKTPDSQDFILVYKSADESSEIKGQVKLKELVKIKSCPDKTFCLIELKDEKLKGYVRRSNLYGVLNDEVFD